MSKRDKKMYGFENSFTSYDETPSFPVEEETMEPTTKKGKLKGATLVNLRKLPSGEAQVIEFVEKDTEFEILEVAQEWTKINYKERKGWIMSKYIEEVS